MWGGVGAYKANLYSQAKQTILHNVMHTWH